MAEKAAKETAEAPKKKATAAKAGAAAPAAQATEGRGGQTGDVRWSAEDELRLLIVHGTLHLCGWDHAEPDEETAMRRLERRILRATGASAAR